MNICQKRMIKSSSKLSIKKSKNKLVIHNKSEKSEKIFFPMPIKTDEKRLRINSKGSINAEENCTIKVED